MNERGINSFDELLLAYLFVGFIVALLWAILEADVVLGPVDATARRRAARLRISRLLAPLGVVHVGFALLAVDAARRNPEETADAVSDRPRGRAALEARAFLGAGLVVLLAASSPHLPMLDAMPGVSALAEALPWE